MTNEKLQKRLRITRIVFVALLLSIGIYAVVGAMLASQRDPAVPSPQPELSTAPLSQPTFIALAAMSLLMLAITPLVRSKLLPPRSFDGEKKLDVDAALSRLLVAQIVSWAFTEMIAVFGLMLTMLSFDPLFVYAFGGVATLVMLAYAPSHKLHLDVVRVASA